MNGMDPTNGARDPTNGPTNGLSGPTNGLSGIEAPTTAFMALLVP